MLTPRRSSSLCRGVSFEVCCVTHTLWSLLFLLLPIPGKRDASVCFQRRSRPPTVPNLSSRSRGHIIILSWESRGRHTRQQRETETERCIIGGPRRTMLLCSLRPPPLQTETVREKVITFWKAFPFGLEDQLLPRPHPLSPSMQFAKKESKSDSVVARRGEPAPSTRASWERRSPWREGRGHRGEQKGRGPTATLLDPVCLSLCPTHPSGRRGNGAEK